MQRAHNVAVPVHTHDSRSLGRQHSDALHVSHEVNESLRELVRIYAVQVAEGQLEQSQHAGQEQAHAGEASEQGEAVGMLAIRALDQWHPDALGVGRQVIGQAGQSVDEHLALTGLRSLQVILCQTHRSGFGYHDEVLVGTEGQSIGESQFVQQHLANILRAVVFEETGT